MSEPGRVFYGVILSDLHFWIMCLRGMASFWKLKEV